MTHDPFINSPWSPDGTTTISAALSTLGRAACHLDELAENDPEAHTNIRFACLAIISELTQKYGQEYFTDEEIDFIGGMYYTLTDDDGEQVHEQ